MLNKTIQKLSREFYWKPRYRIAERLYRYTGIDILTFRRLKELRGLHKGRRVIVMGNGPSLAKIDFETLRNEITFASNKIFLAFDNTSWRPTYFSAEDDLVIIQNIQRLGSKVDPACTVVMPYVCKVYKKNLYADVYFGYSFRKIFDRRQHFGTDAFDELYNGFSIVYTQIQLAIFMGATEIAMIGVDFSFSTDKEEKRNGEFIGGGEMNHFLPNYRKVGERWNLPHLERQKISFALAEERSRALGVKIYNCTEGSKLEVFEKMPLAEFLSPRNRADRSAASEPPVMG
jgi:hypothetical protein